MAIRESYRGVHILVMTPAEPGALLFVSRSKRLYGVANAAPAVLGHLDGGGSLPQVSLI